ncbi:MAG: gamma-glutamylcyclotransferase [Pseudomonadota bacterium]
MNARYRFDGPFAHLPHTARDEALALTRRAIDAEGGLWVFGYGSLLWRPCFDVVESRRAAVAGFAVGLNVWTVEARGTPDRPGLGLGLIEQDGGRAQGVLLKAAVNQLDAALESLWEREMLTGVYQPRWLEAAVVETGEPVRCLGFCVDPTHPQAAPELPIETKAHLIRSASGVLGACTEYVVATVAALEKLGLSHPQLRDVLTRLERDDCL